MKVALTAATRYIGSHVLTELQAHGHEATVRTAKAFGLPIVHSTINVASSRLPDMTPPLANCDDGATSAERRQP